MKWLHLSDLHFNPSEDGTDSIYLRNRLIEFLKEKHIKVDKIFLTGDFRDAAHQDDTDKNAEDAAKFIFEIAESVGVDNTNNILIVPGNHDLDRDFSIRQSIIGDIKDKYNTSNGSIDNLPVLINAFKFFKRILNYIYGEKEANNQFDNVFSINPHKCSIYSNFNVLHLNTELLAGQTILVNGQKKTNDEGSLIVGSKYVINSLINMQHSDNPTIVIAHRGLEQLNAAERRKLIEIFSKFKVCLYLCGHSHDLWCDETYPIPQVTVGCIKQADGVKAGFTIGEFDQILKKITISAFSWDNNCWKEYPHFCSSHNNLVIDISDKVRVLDNDFDNNIKIIIDGRVRAFDCKVDDISFGVERSSFISVCTGKLRCTIKNNKYSSFITINHKFVLSNAVWRVLGVDSTKKGITGLTCERVSKGAYDNFETGIASCDTISNFIIDLLVPIKDIGLEQQLSLTPMLIRDKEQIRDAKFIIESSDKSIIDIRNELIIGVSLGEAQIKISWIDDEDIFETFDLFVKEQKEENIFYRLYKANLDLTKKNYCNFDTLCISKKVVFGVDKFYNGNPVENDQAYDFILESLEGKKQLEVIEQYDSRILFKTEDAASYSNYMLKAINKKTGEVISITFCIKGLW